MTVNQQSGIWCPDKCRILLTTRDVKCVPTCWNVESGLSARIHTDLELNTTNRTSDGVRRTAAEEHPGRPDHPVWHSWDNTGVTQSSRWNSQNPRPVRGVSDPKLRLLMFVHFNFRLSDWTVSQAHIQSLMLWSNHRKNPLKRFQKHALNSFSLLSCFSSLDNVNITERDFQCSYNLKLQTFIVSSSFKCDGLLLIFVSCHCKLPIFCFLMRLGNLCWIFVLFSFKIGNKWKWREVIGEIKKTMKSVTHDAQHVCSCSLDSRPVRSHLWLNDKRW